MLGKRGVTVPADAEGVDDHIRTDIANIDVSSSQPTQTTKLLNLQSYRTLLTITQVNYLVMSPT